MTKEEDPGEVRDILVQNRGRALPPGLLPLRITPVYCMAR